MEKNGERTKGGRLIDRPMSIEWVRIGNMRVAPAAQRQLRPARVDRLVKVFDLDQLGVPVVSCRDGFFYIIDGQHRIEALKQFLGDGWEDQKVQCEVYHGLTEREEADKFDHRNDAIAVSSFDRFNVRLTAGRKDEAEIAAIVQREQLKISRDEIPGAISAVGTLLRVHKRSGPNVLAQTLRIIRDAFGDSALRSLVIDGIGQLCHRYEGGFDEAIVIKKLSDVHGGLGGLMNHAETLHRSTGKPKGTCVAAAAAEIVNRGRGKNILPSWWVSE